MSQTMTKSARFNEAEMSLSDGQELHHVVLQHLLKWGMRWDALHAALQPGKGQLCPWLSSC